jgi:hypothetical protein
MKKIANISVVGLYVMEGSGPQVRNVMKLSMNQNQLRFVDELEAETWRARRHPNNRNIIELYVEPDVMDSRRQLMCDILFQL